MDTLTKAEKLCAKIISEYPTRFDLDEENSERLFELCTMVDEMMEDYEVGIIEGSNRVSIIMESGAAIVQFDSPYIVLRGKMANPFFSMGGNADSIIMKQTDDGMAIRVEYTVRGVWR